MLSNNLNHYLNTRFAACSVYLYIYNVSSCFIIRIWEWMEMTVAMICIKTSTNKLHSDLRLIVFINKIFVWNRVSICLSSVNRCVYTEYCIGYVWCVCSLFINLIENFLFVCLRPIFKDISYAMEELNRKPHYWNKLLIKNKQTEPNIDFIKFRIRIYGIRESNSVHFDTKACEQSIVHHLTEQTKRKSENVTAKQIHIQ